ncbi:hypothetical protein SLEP1_g54167 [Rubroshorea leprosula]|uniref:Integrase catalytic domain-containing protein n=1 Tax=Rubroshorea leprosula TaxID=152421 RepID=A0AAV5MBR0_9ROSI|nr:hypothetical protein SLEP1_g54167 [Rubroshorea leprosula]
MERDDQSPVSPKVASVIVSPDGVLKATFEAQEQSENLGGGGTNVYEFQKQTEEEAIIVPTQDDEEEDMADKIVFEKPEEKMAKHIRPLYINVQMDETPINQVLVDNGAAVNVLPTCILYKIGKSLGDLVHIEIHSSWCVPSTLHQKLIFWNGGKVEVVSANDKPFSANTHLVEARYYEEDIGTIRFFGMNSHGKPIGITACNRLSLSKRVVEEGDEITLEELDLAPAKLDDLKAEVQDPLEEINLRYAKWLSNVVPVLKKNGKLIVYFDFRNLNLATPKDEYPMPIANLLVDGIASHKILSFMDGHSGYNQIFIADTNIPKTASRCPGAAGTFEWVVMPFGMKNIGATYQRAMNAIFHDMIGKFMEIYIDNVVVKSHGEEDHLVHLRKAFEQMRQHGLKMNPLKCAFGVSAGNFLGYLVHERGLEVDKNKAKAVIEAKSPQNQKELRRFLDQKVVKGQALANFLADHPCLEVEADEEKGINLFSISLVSWKLVFDESSTETISRAGVMVISPFGLKTQMSFQLEFDCTNNQVEYEALIIGLEMLVKLKVSMVKVIGDSQLVLKQFICIDVTQIDWRFSIIQYLKDQSTKIWSARNNYNKPRHSFVSHQVEAFAKEMGFHLLNSTPHYAQANGQDEASNKVVINLLEKMVDDNPRRWHELLSKTLWAYRTSQRSSTKMTPFILTYGHDVILPMELTARSLRIAIQHNLQFGEYDEAMMLELEDLEDTRLIVLDRLQAQKLKIVKSYNKRVKGKIWQLVT